MSVETAVPATRFIVSLQFYCCHWHLISLVFLSEFSIRVWVFFFSNLLTTYSTNNYILSSRFFFYNRNVGKWKEMPLLRYIVACCHCMIINWMAFIFETIDLQLWLISQLMSFFFLLSFFFEITSAQLSFASRRPKEN